MFVKFEEKNYIIYGYHYISSIEEHRFAMYENSWEKV